MAAADEEDSWLDRLGSYDEGDRKVTLQSLAVLGPKAVAYASDISRLLEDEYEEVRKAAAVALGKIGIGAAGQARALAAALSDDDPGVRAEAARALGAFGSGVAGQHGEAVARLARDLDEGVQLAAVECLVAVSEASRLGAFFGSAFVAVLRAALLECGRSPQARVEHAGLIADKLRHSDATVRLAAVQASGEVGAACSAAHVAALGALAGGGPRGREAVAKVRRAAVQALGRAGDAGVPCLLLFFGDVDEGVRFFAAETVALVGGSVAAAAVADFLAKGGACEGARQAALAALGKLRADGLAHAPAVAGHLRDADFQCRLAAIQALSDMGAASEASAVGGLAGDASPGIRQAAVAALAKMGGEGASEAVRFLEDSDPGVRQAAVKVYSPLHSKLPEKLARPYAGQVASRLLDEDWRVRLAAVVALGDLGVAQYSPQVAALRGDADNQVRRSAVVTLEKFRADPVLVAGFLGDDDRRVRDEAERAYRELGGGAGAGDDGELSEVE